jgi:DNA primase
VTTTAATVEHLVVARGVQLARKGDVLVGACPFHDGKAKLVLDPKANAWTCTKCGVENGGAVEWVMRAEGVSRKHAAGMLREGEITLTRKNEGPKKGAVPTKTTVRAMGFAFKADDPDHVILEDIADFYARALEHHEQAKAFLQDRGLRHPGLARHFKLGAADKTIGLHIPLPNRLLGRQVRDRLRALGIFRSDTGHEQLNGCLVVPLFDTDGKIVNLYGRRVDRSRRDSGGHNWTDDTRRGLLNPGAFTEAAIVVTASVTDALSCWAYGIQHVTALHGIDGPTEELIAALKNGGVKKVTFLMRRTKETTRFTAKLAKDIAKLGITVYRGLLPHDTDVNEFVRSMTDAEHALLQVVRSAEWLAGTPPEEKPIPRRPEDLPGPAPVPAVVEPVRGQPGVTDDELVHVVGDRRWRVRGLADARHVGVLKLNVLVSRDDVGFHVDSFDLYAARNRAAFIKQASTELGLEEDVVRKDIGTVLLLAEQAQAELLRRHQTPQPTRIELTADEREDALRLLQDPKLLERVLDVFAAQGVVGERDNLLLGFLAVTSRKLRRPLGVVIQSSSAAGKSSLMEAVLSVVPEEDRVSYSAMTGQSLFYAPGSDLKHKVLAIAEEEGAARASYSLKLLQSEGSLTIASTGKDPGSGRLVSQEYKVEGPVALLLTTTSIEVDEELLNRCVILTVDESPEQTRRIHERQRRNQTLDGVLAAGDRLGLLRRAQNAQRILRPVAIVNPHVESVAFADLRVRARRDHQKLLTLIEAVAFLHQAQRPWRSVEHEGRVVEYIEATREDVELAENLLEKLGAIGVHDLPPQTLKILELISGFVRAQKEPGKFSRRELREALGVGDTQLKTHLRRLVDVELLVVHRAPVGNGVVYELAYDYDTDRSGVGRPSVGPRSAQGRGEVGAPTSTDPVNIAGGSDGDGVRGRKRTSMGSPSNGVVRAPRRS